MSALGALLESHADALWQRWSERQGRADPPATAPRPELRDQIPSLLRELRDALRAGRAPASSAAATDHGHLRRELGFDLEAVVHEYGLLTEVILDAAEAAGLALTISELRVVTEFVSRAVAVSIAAHRLHRERQRVETEREHLRALVATAPIGIATWRGPEHRFESANELYLRALGRPAALSDQPIFQVFSELPTGHPLFAIYDEVYRSGRPFVDPEYRLRLTLDGRSQERVYVFHLNPVRGAGGRVDGVMAYVAEVTEAVRFRELVEVERDLANAVATIEADSRRVSEESRARTEFLLAVAGTLSESLDLDVLLQRFVDVIASAQGTFAAVWSAEPGAALRRLVHAPFNAALASAWASTDERDPASLPVERVIATGETLRLDDYAAWMSDAGAPEVGRTMAAIGVRAALVVPIRRGATIVAVLAIAGAREVISAQDVVVFESVARLASLAFENARLFGEMARLRATAEEATVEKDRFLARVSHDLRNPLNSILGWSSLLRAAAHDPAHLARGLEVIERNARSQVQLIEDLLDVSRITSGKLSLALAVQDVRAAIDTALDATRLAAAAKGVSLVVLVDDDVGAVTVDPDRFRQILWNLASNAVKFTPRGGTVRVSAERLDSTLRIVVADSGRGIAPALLPHIFESFLQAEAGAARSGGLGLGLAIARHLVELHGGTVVVASEGEGQGARFTVDLPIRAAAPATQPSGSTDAPRPLEGVRLLVVDDEVDVREVVTAILEHAGAVVTVAASADEALASLARQRPDAIVSDVGMPGRDGKAFVRDLRALPEAQGGRLPALALTALVRAKDRAEILAAGFDAHAAKPVEPAALVLTVAGLLRRVI